MEYKLLNYIINVRINITGWCQQNFGIECSVFFYYILMEITSEFQFFLIGVLEAHEKISRRNAIIMLLTVKLF